MGTQKNILRNSGARRMGAREWAPTTNLAPAPQNDISSLLMQIDT